MFPMESPNCVGAALVFSPLALKKLTVGPISSLDHLNNPMLPPEYPDDPTKKVLIAVAPTKLSADVLPNTILPSPSGVICISPSPVLVILKLATS